MSNGYLIISNSNLDALQKNRHMKFEKVVVPGNWYGYSRMTYLNGHCQLIDEEFSERNSCNLSEYGRCFFASLQAKEIYFVYFLLTKNITLENVISNALKIINTKTEIKIPVLFLHNSERQGVEQDKIYRISDKPPEHGYKQWRR